MKRLFKTLVLMMNIALVFSISSCEKEKEQSTQTNFSKAIIGTWVTEKANGQAIGNNDKTVWIIAENGTIIEQKGVATDSLKRKWMTYNHQYTLNDKTFSFNGLKYEISSIDDNAMTYANNGSTITMVKKNLDDNSKIVGWWKKTLTDSDMYMNYKNDGHMSNYLFNSTNGFSLLMNCNYQIFGDFIVTTWKGYSESNDNYSCSNVTFENDVMHNTNDAGTLDFVIVKDYSEKITGTYVDYFIEGSGNYTCDKTVCSFYNGVEMFAGVVETENGHRWQECYDYNYFVYGDIIDIRGINGIDSHLVIRISEENGIVNMEQLWWKLNGVMMPLNKGVMNKVDIDLKNKLAGSWIGYGTMDPQTKYYWYFDVEKMLFDFYYPNETGGYDVQYASPYFMYGNFYVNNYVSYKTGIDKYEAFDVVFGEDGNTMRWTMKTAEGLVVYEFTKSELPR